MIFTEMEEKLNRYLGYLEQDQTNVDLLLTVSAYCLQLGDRARAQNYLDQAKTNSGQPFWSKQGIVYLETQQLEAAQEAFVEALKEEQSPTNIFNLSFCLFLSQNYEAALALIINIPELPDEVLFMKAKILLHLQKPDDAIALLKALQNKNPDDADVSGLLALLYFDLYELELAEFLSTHALECNPYQYDALLTVLLLKTFNKEATVSEIQTFLSSSPNESRLWFALGILFIKEEQIHSAIESFTKVTEIWPHFYEAWIQLGWCSLYQDDLEKTVTFFQKAVTIDENKADGWGGLSLVYALQNNNSKASHCLTKALSLNNQCYLAELSDLILKNQCQSGNKKFVELFPDAIKTIDELLTK